MGGHPLDETQLYTNMVSGHPKQRRSLDAALSALVLADLDMATIPPHSLHQQRPPFVPPLRRAFDPVEAEHASTPL